MAAHLLDSKSTKEHLRTGDTAGQTGLGKGKERQKVSVFQNKTVLVVLQFQINRPGNVVYANVHGVERRARHAH